MCADTIEMPATAVASQTATAPAPASGRKRKVAFEASERPAKKQQTSGSIKVNHLNRPGAVQPVIGEGYFYQAFNVV